MNTRGQREGSGIKFFSYCVTEECVTLRQPVKEEMKTGSLAEGMFLWLTPYRLNKLCVYAVTDLLFTDLTRQKEK